MQLLVSIVIVGIARAKTAADTDFFLIFPPWTDQWVPKKLKNWRCPALAWNSVASQCVVNDVFTDVQRKWVTASGAL